MSTRPQFWGAAVGAASLLLAVSAFAQAETIDFEGELEGTSAATLYDGVSFYLIDANTGAVRARDPVIAVEGTGNNAANRLAYIANLGAGVIDDPTPFGDALLSDGGTFDSSQYGAFFDGPKSLVSLQFMDFSDCISGVSAGDPTLVGLRAYDASGAVVDSSAVIVPYQSLPDGSNLLLVVSGEDIWSVETYGDADCGNGIDEFTHEDQDSDGDGIPDVDDACPDSIHDIDAPVPTVTLGVNRWADVDDDGVFETTAPRGRGPGLSFTIEDTQGCYCADIIEALELGNGHTKRGCSISAMQDWIAQLP